MEVWGGIECSVNRVKNSYYDQLDYSGHYHRVNDIDVFAGLGIKKMRYPVLWEIHQPEKDTIIEWQGTEARLGELRNYGIAVIAGLMHHGSGPAFVSILDDVFPAALAAYAKQVAQKFPWINYYTPINEPLTTARFCGLYGIWHPHKNDDKSFCRILVNECRATILAMQEIRKINPYAKLIQTDDLGKVHSTPLLKYQADFENNRRWLSFDLLCGAVNEHHPLKAYLLDSGITEQELQFFIDHKYKPDILGLNHYLTSERYLDENLGHYPTNTHGGNNIHKYADVETVRMGHVRPDGPYRLLEEAWERYKLPLAMTEVHLSCTREEQMRWLNQTWTNANRLKQEGIDVLAIAVWALLGSFGWNRLLTQPNGDYEPGIFDLSNKQPRPTLLASMVKSYSAGKKFIHPVLGNRGWWERKCRIVYSKEFFLPDEDGEKNHGQPVLIIGKNGALGSAFEFMCIQRNITYKVLSRHELDITKPKEIEKVLLDINPWAIVNAAGFEHIDDAEIASVICFAVNAQGPGDLAILCEKYSIKLLTFSTDLVFNGLKTAPYTEKDVTFPLSVYGRSKVQAEYSVLQHNPTALIIRRSAFFGPWDKHNFIKLAIQSLRVGRNFIVANDVTISPTYIPDLVNRSLDLMIDNESGIWHLSNDGKLTWAEFAYSIASRLGLRTELLKPVPINKCGLKAIRPLYSVLKSDRGGTLPSLDNAIERYIVEIARV